jgi:hypothetical protein
MRSGHENTHAKAEVMATMTLCSDWPHNWWGMWKTAEADPFDLPLFEEVVDATWVPEDLTLLLAYLNASPVSLASGAMPRDCPLCGETLFNVGSQRSDGLWVWPASLTHYMVRHQVRLPDRMVSHIRERQGR